MSWEENRGTPEPGRAKRLAELAEVQDGAISLGQLRKLGLSQRAAEYRAEQGTLHRVHRGVYAVGLRPTTRLGTLRAAVLACGEGALISHGTAAALWGLRDRWPVLADITGPAQAGRKIDGVRCRRCRYPSVDEIGLHEGLPCTSPARTLVDLAGMLGTDSLGKAVERAAMRRRLDLRALDQSMRDARRRRGIASLRAILETWRTDDESVPDLRSDFEALVLPRLVAMGLPRPACNVRLDLDGEMLMVDFLWEGQRVVVETDGKGTHATPVAFQRDRRRDQFLIAAGYRVARVTWDQVQHDGDAVVARIARALGTQGTS